MNTEKIYLKSKSIAYLNLYLDGEDYDYLNNTTNLNNFIKDCKSSYPSNKDVTISRYRTIRVVDPLEKVKIQSCNKKLISTSSSIVGAVSGGVFAGEQKGEDYFYLYLLKLDITPLLTFSQIKDNLVLEGYYSDCIKSRSNLELETITTLDNIQHIDVSKIYTVKEATDFAKSMHHHLTLLKEL